MANEWLSMRLDCLGAMIVFLAGILAIVNRDNVSPSLAGERAQQDGRGEQGVALNFARSPAWVLIALMCLCFAMPLSVGTGNACVHCLHPAPLPCASPPLTPHPTHLTLPFPSHLPLQP